MDSAFDTMARYDMEKKSVGLTYVFFLFLGSAGAHRFYAGKIFSGLIFLLLFLLMLAMPPFSIILLLFLIFDLFYIPRMIKKINYAKYQRIKNGEPPV